MILSINRKNYYITQRIAIRLKIVKMCSINKTWFIEYSQMQLHDNKCADMIFELKIGVD